MGDYAAAKPDDRASISEAQSERSELTPTLVLRLHTCAVVRTYKHTQTHIITVKENRELERWLSGQAFWLFWWTWVQFQAPTWQLTILTPVPGYLMPSYRYKCRKKANAHK